MIELDYSERLGQSKKEDLLFLLNHYEAVLKTKPGEEQFTLASGKKSDIYIDCRRLTLVPDGLDEAAAQLHDSLRLRMMEINGMQKQRYRSAYVGTVGIGGGPLLGAVLQRFFYWGPAGWRGFVVREKPKEHGLKTVIEGHKPIVTDRPVFLIDDVLTSGNTMLKVVEMLANEYEQKIDSVHVLIDRQEGGRELLEAKGLKVYSLLKLSDLDN